MNVWTIIWSIVASVATSVGGVGLLLRYGGDFWLARTKAKWDKELEEFKGFLNTEQRRYQAQLDRSIFVSRAHFDTEFQAIKEVHQCLSEVKIPFRSLFPISATVVVTDAQSADLIERLQQASNRFIAKLEEWGVFLEPSQYDELKRCNDAIEHFLEVFPRQGSEMERDYGITRRHFWDSYSAACQKARDRIEKLAVLPKS
ncbi:MAG: hypothetical protein ABR991_12475 [Terracidiphilus sp.]|jgi:hypothetical protein